MTSEKMKSFNYAIGMFGTSIPINMLKTYAAVFYVANLGCAAGCFRIATSGSDIARTHRLTRIRVATSCVREGSSTCCC